MDQIPEEDEHHFMPDYLEMQSLIFREIQRVRIDDEGNRDECGQHTLQHIATKLVVILPTAPGVSAVHDSSILWFDEISNLEPIDTIVTEMFNEYIDSSHDYPVKTLQNTMFTCMANSTVSSTISKWLGVKRTTLLWQGVLQAFFNEIQAAEINTEQLSIILMKCELTSHDNTLMLEDILMDTTSYGRMLKRAKFEEVCQLLKNSLTYPSEISYQIYNHDGDNYDNFRSTGWKDRAMLCLWPIPQDKLPAVLQELKSAAEQYIIPILEAVRDACVIRDCLVHNYYGGEEENQDLPDVRNDVAILEIILQRMNGAERSPSNGQPEVGDVEVGNPGLIPEILAILREEGLMYKLLKFVHNVLRTLELEHWRNVQRWWVPTANTIGKYISQNKWMKLELLERANFPHIAIRAGGGEQGFANVAEMRGVVDIGQLARSGEQIEAKFYRVGMVHLVTCCACICAQIGYESRGNCCGNYIRRTVKMFYDEVKNEVLEFENRGTFGTEWEMWYTWIASRRTAHNVRLGIIKLHNFTEVMGNARKLVRNHYINRDPWLKDNLGKMLDENGAEFKERRERIISAIDHRMLKIGNPTRQFYFRNQIDEAIQRVRFLHTIDDDIVPFMLALTISELRSN